MSLEDINQELVSMGIEPIEDIDPCPERTRYIKALNNIDFADKEQVKELKGIRESYLLAFHNYFADVYKHLFFEIGEDKNYWNYNKETGIYDEVNFSIVRGFILNLLIKDGLSSNATEAMAKIILSRYRSMYVERGKNYDDFDKNDEWFHSNNGWVNLQTLEFIEHSPILLSRKKSAVDYKVEAICPIYDKFLDEDLSVTEDKVRVIKQFSGLCLTNDIRYQKMLTLIGRPGCGKSTLLEIWSYILGDRAIEKKLTELTGDAMRFAGSQFIGSNLCWFDEVDVKKAEMGNSLGTLITGSHINVERKGINGIIKAKNTVKCVLTANRLPMSAELGIYRRLIMIHLPKSFTEEEVEDKEMSNKLRGEASGVLNRMIEGLQDLRKMRGFTVIAGHEELIEEYKAQSDTMAEFLDTYFDPSNHDDFIETQVLFDSYQHFAEGNSFTKSITPQKFGRLLSTQPLNRFAKIAPKRTMTSRGWTGLKLKTEYKFNNENTKIVPAFVVDF